MTSDQHDKLNKLLGSQGSIAERTRMAKDLDDDRLQTAAPYSPQAKEELERRRHERLLASREPVTLPPDAEIQRLDDQYVSAHRIEELRSLKAERYDVTRLIRLCEELNAAYDADSYMSIGMLVRAIVDHVPPIFATKKFSEVANNYAGQKSFKSAMQHLDKSLRYAADALLHVQVRRKEVLPSFQQVDFRADLDALLAEIVRVLS